MLITNVIILLSVILPICIAISLFRNYFLQHYSGSPKKYKGYMLIFLYIGSLLCSLFSGYIGFHIFDVQKQLTSGFFVKTSEFEAIKSYIFSESKTALVFVVIGMILFFLTFFLKKSIQKDIIRISKDNVSWDLSKLSKT